MNRHMTTAHSNEIDSQILIDQDPGSGSEIRDPDPDPGFFKTGIRIRSETDRIRNTGNNTLFLWVLQQGIFMNIMPINAESFIYER